MRDESPLDRAHRRMRAAPGDAAAQLGWYHAFADAELCLLLDREPHGDDLAPRLIALDEGSFVLAFDGEERLAAFSDAPVPYAALPGRVIVQALAGQRTGVGVNLGGDDAAFLMPATAVDWLADALAHAPALATEEPVAWQAPALAALATDLSHGLSGFGALAARAWLAGARYADGRSAHVLVFEDAAPASQAALAKAASELLLFSAANAEAIDLTFLSAARVKALALPTFAAPVTLQAPQAPAKARTISPPGSDPARPPRLR